MVAAPGPDFDATATATEAAVQAALTAAGASALKVTVTVVEAIPAGAAGKRPLVIVFPPLQLPDAQ